MKTTVFAYKGIIGIKSDVKSEGLINDPTQPGQLGFVLDASQVEFSPEAIEALKKIKRGHGSLGDVDCFKSDDGQIVFAFLGGPWAMFDPESGVEAARDTDFNLLTPTDGVEIPEDFKKAVDED